MVAYVRDTRRIPRPADPRNPRRANAGEARFGPPVSQIHSGERRGCEAARGAEEKGEGGRGRAPYGGQKNRDGEVRDEWRKEMRASRSCATRVSSVSKSCR